MEKQEINLLIKEYQQFIENVEVMPRPIELEANANYIFVGLRRAGKSYLLYQTIKSLLKSGRSIDDILFVNFEDERFIEADTKDLNRIMECYAEMYDRKPIVFLDEVQVVPGWQKFVRRLADQKYLIYVSGSNAEMLSNEIATTLGGRFIIHEVYPYSFAEFLAASQINLKKNWEYSSLKNTVVRQSDNYLQFGGLPEIIGKASQRPWISSLYQKIFLGDIVTRYAIRNDNALRLIVKKLAESVMHPISYNRLANIVSSAGKKVSVSTTIEYLKYLSASWLIFGIPNYVSALTEHESIKKYYFIDNGILQLFLTDAKTRLLENIVAINLYKRYGDELFFYKKNIEVDFYVQNVSLAIQVSYNIGSAETIDREVKALSKLHRAFPLKHCLIVTYNEEKTIQSDGLEIEIVPVWKWLLYSLYP